MMKRNLLGLMAGVAISLSAISARAEQLTIATWLPPSHSMTSIAMPGLAAMISEATGGNVTAVIKTGVGAPPAMIDMVQDGVIDIAYMFNGYNPGRFTGTKIIELPGYEGSSEAISVAYWRAHVKYLETLKEHGEVKVIGLMVHGPGQLHVNDSINDLASLVGKKIRIGGGVMGAVAKELGVVGVSAPGSKVYEFLSTGVADGVMMPVGSRRSLKVNEVTAQLIETPGGLYRGAFSIIMNQEKYDSLSAEDKAELDKVFGEQVSKMAGKAWDVEDEGGYSILAETNKPIVKFSDADEAKLDEVFAKVTTDVLAEINSKGVDAEQVQAFIKEQISAYK